MLPEQVSLLMSLHDCCKSTLKLLACTPSSRTLPHPTQQLTIVPSQATQPQLPQIRHGCLHAVQHKLHAAPCVRSTRVAQVQHLKVGKGRPWGWPLLLPLLSTETAWAGIICRASISRRCSHSSSSCCCRWCLLVAKAARGSGAWQASWLLWHRQCLDLGGTCRGSQVSCLISLQGVRRVKHSTPQHSHHRFAGVSFAMHADC